MSTLQWTGEVESVCENLRINCVNLSEYHRRRYYRFKSYGKYFRLPMIVLASVNSTASVGLQPLLQQEIISGITCLLGLIMGIIGAIELYMGIQTSMELELKQSKEFYSLAIDLYKVLSLRRENRGEGGKDYLNKRYAQYTKLCEASNLLKRKLKVDLLTTIPEEYEDKSRTPTPIQQYMHEQQRLAMQEFEEPDQWYTKICKYLCRCMYDEGSLNSDIHGNNLEFYKFPEMNKHNNSRYYKPYEHDIENQNERIFHEASEVLQLHNNMISSNDEVKEEEIKEEEIKEESNKEMKEEVEEEEVKEEIEKLIETSIVLFNQDESNEK